MSLEASAPPMIEGNTVGAVPPGEMLRAARERAGMTQEDIAGKLKLAARQIAAIETGDWASLPERTFTRGFMRSYARLVSLDPASLGLELPASQSAPTAEIKASSSEAMNEVTFDPSGKSRSATRWLVPALLVAALVAGVAYFQGGYLASLLPAKLGGTPPPSLKTAVAAQAEQADAARQAQAAATTPANGSTSSGSVIAPPTAVNAPQSGTPEAAPASSANATAATGSTTANGIVSPPVANPETSTAANTPPVAPAIPPLLGERRVSITFKGKSWTEVRSKGEVIFSENAQPGTREFSGMPPLSFAVGNASNVTLLIDGKPFDMANVTRNDVARFRIE